LSNENYRFREYFSVLRPGILASIEVGNIEAKEEGSRLHKPQIGSHEESGPSRWTRALDRSSGA
jgi:hypothetical protein